MKNKENILIIKHGALGDLIQVDGVIKSIRDKYKNEKIILLTSKKFSNLMSICPHIDNVIIDKRSFFLNVFAYISLYKQVAKYNFKIVYDLQNSQRTYFYRKYLFFNLKWISTNRKNHKISGLRGLEEMLKENSIDTKNALRPDVKWLSADVKNLLKVNGIPTQYIVLVPGSSKNNPLKRWPYFKKLTKKLILKGYQVVTILGPDELELDYLLPGHVLKNLNWFQLSGVIENSYFLIGNDSGPCHIASCLNKKGLALFGPTTSPIRSELKRGKFEILEVNNLENLTSDEVFIKIKSILHKI